MKHVTALIVLFIAVSAVFALTLGWLGEATVGQVLMVALVLTPLAYVIGDLIVLPATNTWVGLLVDALTVWGVLRLTVPAIAVGAPLFWSIAGIGIAGYFYHLYLYETVIGVD